MVVDLMLELARVPLAEHIKSLVDMYSQLSFTRNRDVTGAERCIKPS